MEALNWLTAHWFDLLQTIGIVGGLLLTASTLRRDERARRIGNSIAINRQYREIWEELYERPALARVLAKQVDLKNDPISLEEEIFVSSLILHLSTVHRAMRVGEFVQYEGLQRDVKEFFSLPIPSFVWRNVRQFQDVPFVKFVETALAETSEVATS